MKLEFEDNTSLIEDRNFDTFFVGFNNNIFLRESCYKCRYCGCERIADFTIADFWGVNPKSIPEEQIKLGVSLILANSDKAKMIINDLKRDMHIESIDSKLAIPYNLALSKPNDRPKQRSTFFINMEKKGFNKTVKYFLRKYYLKIYLRKVLIAIFGEAFFHKIRVFMKLRRYC